MLAELYRSLPEGSPERRQRLYPVLDDGSGLVGVLPWSAVLAGKDQAGARVGDAMISALCRRPSRRDPAQRGRPHGRPRARRPPRRRPRRCSPPRRTHHPVRPPRSPPETPRRGATRRTRADVAPSQSNREKRYGTGGRPCLLGAHRSSDGPWNEQLSPTTKTKFPNGWQSSNAATTSMFVIVLPFNFDRG